MKNNKQLINKSKIIYYWIFVFIISFFAITYYVVVNNSTSKIIDISSFEWFLVKGEIKEVTVINKNLAQVTLTRDALNNPDHQSANRRQEIQILQNLIDKLTEEGLSKEEIQAQIDIKKVEFRKSANSKKNLNGYHYVLEIGSLELFQNKLEQAKANGVQFNYYFKTVKNTWLYILISFISLLILVGLWMFFKKELPDSENIKNNYEDKIDKSQNDLNNGKDKLNSKDYDGAIEDFNKAIEIDPNNTSAFHCRGISKEKIKDYEGAMADLEKAIEIETDDNHLIEYKKSLKEFKERMRNKLAGLKAVKALDKYAEELKTKIKDNKK